MYTLHGYKKKLLLIDTMYTHNYSRLEDIYICTLCLYSTTQWHILYMYSFLRFTLLEYTARGGGGGGGGGGLFRTLSSIENTLRSSCVQNCGYMQ